MKKIIFIRHLATAFLASITAISSTPVLAEIHQQTTPQGSTTIKVQKYGNKARFWCFPPSGQWCQWSNFGVSGDYRRLDSGSNSSFGEVEYRTLGLKTANGSTSPNGGTWSISPNIGLDKYEVGGVGHDGEGAGIAIADLDRNGIKDYILMAYDAPNGANSFRIKIGWNPDYGDPKSWTSYQVGGVGHVGDGAGIAIANLDGNNAPEMILMAYDAPDGPNQFRIKIGWNLSTSGTTSIWTSYSVPGLGHDGEGAGVAIGDIDKNGIQDMVLMAYDAPSGENSFVYKIGWNLRSDGITNNWSGAYKIRGVGHVGEGADVVLADYNKNGTLDIFLMAYDAPEGENSFRYKVGYDLNSNGNASSWSNQNFYGLGHVGDGAGMAVVDLNRDNKFEGVFMAYDAPDGGNNFRYWVVWGE